MCVRRTASPPARPAAISHTPALPLPADPPPLPPSPPLSSTRQDGVKLACRALLEVVEAGGKNIEVAVLRQGKELQLLGDDEVEAIVKGIEAEKEEEDKKKKKPSEK